MPRRFRQPSALSARGPDYHIADGVDLSPTVDLGDRLNSFLLAALPLVGFVLLCVRAFGRDTLPSKANRAKATLLLYAPVLGLAFVGLPWFARLSDQVI